MRTGLVVLVGMMAGCGGRSGARADVPVHPAMTTDAGPNEPAAAVVRADLTLTTSDGVELAATYVAGPAEVGRCVVFAHQLGGSRAEWDPVLARLGAEVHAVTFDLRGHGGSTQRGAQALDWRAFDSVEWGNLALDLEAVREFLATMQIATDGCVYVGSSIGASAVLRFAGKYFDVAGLALWSPGLAYRGLDVLEASKQYAGPVLLIASDEVAPRAAAAQLAETWRARSADAPVTVVHAIGAGHGVQMAKDDPAVIDAVVQFIISVRHGAVCSVAN